MKNNNTQYNLFAFLFRLKMRIMGKTFNWLRKRVSIFSIDPMPCHKFEIVIGLDLPESGQLLHEIRLPINLSEYPDILRAKWLTVYLEREGRDGDYLTLNCLHLHAGPDFQYSPPPMSAGIRIHPYCQTNE